MSILKQKSPELDTLSGKKRPRSDLTSPSISAQNTTKTVKRVQKVRDKLANQKLADQKNQIAKH
jgi:hypothetical protein